jgi:hypothetical protein
MLGLLTVPAFGQSGGIPGLPTVPNLSSEDSVAVGHNGGDFKATLGQVAQLFGLTLPTIDLNFVSGVYLGQNCTTLTACLSATNNGGYAQWSDGHWSSFPNNTARVTDLGLLYETAATTNPILWSRDMSQSAWTKSNVTVAKTAVGIDNTPNAASTLTATSSNGTVCQSVTSSNPPFAEFTGSVFLKRVSGSGEVDISMEGTVPGHSGTVWSPVTKGSGSLSASWQRFVITYDATTINPTLCIRIVTNGDVVAADFGQIEPRVWVTSPILTSGTIATRQSDAVSFTNGAATLLNASAATAVFATSGAAAGNFRHQISSPYFAGSPSNGYLWQYAAMAMFFNDGGEGSGAPPYSICGNVALVSANQSMALPAIFGISWGNGTVSVVCDGGALQYSGGTAPSPQTWYIGSSTAGPTTYTTEIKLYNSKLGSDFFQSSTQKTNNASITDQIPDSGWSNFTQAAGFSAQVGGTLPAFSGGPTQNLYGFESGLNSSGVTGPIQFGSVGNMIRFNMYANNCGVDDDCTIGTFGGSERVELDGSTGATGNAQFATATDAWMSYSVCIEPGAALTSNWFFNGQVHQTINPAGGGSPPFDMNTKIGDIGRVEYVSDANQAVTVAYEWKQLRGVWYNYVLQLNFDPTGAQGKIHVWQNGIQVVNFNGVTGETPTSGTQQYYWKFGTYRGQSPEYEAVRYANMTYSTSSLAAKVASPDAIPSGYGTTCQ